MRMKNTFRWYGLRFCLGAALVALASCGKASSTDTAVESNNVGTDSTPVLASMTLRLGEGGDTFSFGRPCGRLELRQTLITERAQSLRFLFWSGTLLAE